MKSAWYNKSILPTEMVKGINGKLGWPKLENSWHFKYLDDAIKSCGKITSIIDLGCGGGEVGRVYKNINYIGYDLSHIIEKVGRITNPDLHYKEFDAFTTDFNFCNDADIVLSNSFITELNNCTEILDKIFSKSNKYIILHRQKFNNNKEWCNDYKTYGGLNTVNCHISTPQFNKMIKDKFEIIYSSTYNNMKTLTLKKI